MSLEKAVECYDMYFGDLNSDFKKYFLYIKKK
jgi:hypothetical protein